MVEVSRDITPRRRRGADAITNRKERHSAIRSGRLLGGLTLLRILDALRLCAAGLVFAVGFVALLWLAELAAFR